jgi:hypothetical protein
LTRPEKEAKENEEEGAEDKEITCLGAVTVTAAAKTEDSINVVCNKV